MSIYFYCILKKRFKITCISNCQREGLDKPLFLPLTLEHMINLITLKVPWGTWGSFEWIVLFLWLHYILFDRGVFFRFTVIYFTSSLSIFLTLTSCHFLGTIKVSITLSLQFSYDTLFLPVFSPEPLLLQWNQNAQWFLNSRED